MPYFSDYCNRQSCVYRLYNASGDLLYVGMAVDPQPRITAHKRKPWGRAIVRAEITWHANRFQAKTAERTAIHDEKPLHNIVRPRLECCQ